MNLETKIKQLNEQAQGLQDQLNQLEQQKNQVTTALIKAVGALEVLQQLSADAELEKESKKELVN